MLIAAKELAQAKTRLGTRLPQPERRLLAEAMFRDVLHAALGSRLAQRIAVVTSDRTLLGLARDAGVMLIDEEFPRGLNAAVALATTRLAEAGAITLCTLLSDIPLLTSADIDLAFEMAPSDRGVLLVPSHDSKGTNIMVRTPPAVIPTRFGGQSLGLHLTECEKRKVECRIVPMERPAMDLDEVSDLLSFLRVGSATYTHCQLSRMGLALV